MATTEVLQARLDEAEEALHRIELGQGVRVFVDQNGERIEYTASNRSSLQAYIRKLKFQLNPSSEGGPMGITIT